MISFAKHVKDPQLAGRGLLSAENAGEFAGRIQ